MSTILHLGVAELPYVEPPAKPKKLAKVRHGRQKPRAKARADAAAAQVTTGEVAEFLETHYGVMEVFWNTHEDQCGALLTEGLKSAFEQLASGAGPVGLNPYAEAVSKIADMFKLWLTSGEAERAGIPGTPTLAAQHRQSARFKSGTADKNRPSFVDTGLYEASMTAWIEERLALQ
jgi:hypothetical protein